MNPLWCYQHIICLWKHWYLVSLVSDTVTLEHTCSIWNSTNINYFIGCKHFQSFHLIHPLGFRASSTMNSTPDKHPRAQPSYWYHTTKHTAHFPSLINFYQMIPGGTGIPPSIFGIIPAQKAVKTIVQQVFKTLSWQKYLNWFAHPWTYHNFFFRIRKLNIKSDVHWKL